MIGRFLDPYFFLFPFVFSVFCCYFCLCLSLFYFCLAVFCFVCLSIFVCYFYFVAFFCFLCCCICFALLFQFLLFLHIETKNKYKFYNCCFLMFLLNLGTFDVFIGFLTCIICERCIIFQLRGFMLDVNHCCNCGSDKYA